MFKYLSFLVVTLFMTNHLSSQDIDRSNYQLLWEITGNDLEKPSYLFGSMHVKDSRVFEFCDSMLICLESCDGYSAELNMDSLVVYIMEAMFSEDDSNVLKDVLSQDAYDALNNKLLNQKGTSIDELPNKQPWIIDMLLENNERENQENDFESFLDLYLYNYSKKIGKKTYGLEDIEDQLNLSLLEFQTYEDYIINNSLNNDSPENFEKELESLLQLYIAGDINAIEKMIKEEGGDEIYIKKLLTDRNVVMADNMEKLSKKMGMFHVVGAAHLPGNTGVIQLLKDKGFRLRPISPDFNGKAKFKDVSKVKLPWHKLDLANSAECSLEFPIPAVKAESYDGMDFSMFDFYVSMDMETQSAFIFMGLDKPDRYEGMTDDEILDDLGLGMYRSLIDDGDDPEITDIRHGLLKGKEINGYSEEKGQVAIKGFLSYQKIYLMIAQNGTGEIKDKDRFFSSFKYLGANNPPPPPLFNPKNNKKVITKNSTVHLDRYAVSFVAPSEMTKTNNRLDYPVEDEGVFEVDQIIFRTSSKNVTTQYAFQVYDLPLGIYLEDYNETMSSAIEQLESNEGLITKKNNSIIDRDITYFELEATFQNEVYLRVGYFFRGNRLGSFVVSGENKKNVDKEFKAFSESVKFHDFKKTSFTKNKFEEVGLSYIAPESSPNIVQEDFEYPYVDYITQISQDSNSSAMFMIEAMELSEYYEINNPDSFLLDVVEIISEEFDTIINKKLHRYKGYPAIDFTAISDNTYIKTEMRGVIVDNWLYYGNAIMPAELYESKISTDFFNSFDFDSNFKRSKPFVSKSKKILDNISTTKQKEYEILQEAVLNHEFKTEDIPALHQAIKKEIPLDTSSEYTSTLRERFIDVLIDLNNENTIPALSDIFNQVTPELQLYVLGAISHIEKGTSDEYWELITKFDDKNYKESTYAAFSYFYDYPEILLKKIPEFMTVYKNGIFKFEIINMIRHNVVNTSSLDWASALEPYQEELLEELKNNFKSSDTDNSYILQNIIILGSNLFNRDDFLLFHKNKISSASEVFQYFIAIQLLQNGYEIDNSIWKKLDQKNKIHDVLYSISDENDNYAYSSLVPKKYKNQATSAKYGMMRMIEQDYTIGNIKFLEMNEIKISNTSYNQYVYLIQRKSEGEILDERIIGTCIYPSDKKSYSLVPRYYNYDLFDEENISMEETLDMLMSDFEED